MALRAALRFALGTGAPRPGERRVSLSLPGGDTQDALLVPARGRARGTIVAVHGMSPLAETDPRWRSALRDLAAAGFTVVSPRFEGVARLEIDPGQPDDIAASLRAVADDGELAPRGRVGVFSVSFSGGLSLRAAAAPALTGRVSGVCALGTYGDLPSTLRALFAREDGDPYGLLIVLANYIERVDGPLPGGRAALLRAARANFEDAEIDPVAHLGEAVPEATRTRLTELLTDPAARLALLTRVQASCADDFEQLDPLAELPGPSVPVTLLHGTHDPVIPADQSVRLAEAVRRRGGRARLSVTTLLGHGDRAGSALAALREGPRTVGALAGYFRDCSD